MRMIELLEGRPTARLNLTLTPRLKKAVVTMADGGDQDLSQLVRHLLVRELERRNAAVKAEHIEFEDLAGKRRLLGLARVQEGP